MSGLVAGAMHAFVMGTGFAVEQEVAAFALHAMWQVPLLACAAALAVRIGRPHVRIAHVLWVATLAMCVAVPLVSTVLAHRAAVAAARAALIDAESGGVTVAFGDFQPMREPAWKLAFERHVLSPTPFAFQLSPRVARGITLVYALIAMGLAFRLLVGWRRTRSLLRTSNTLPMPPEIVLALRRQCDAIGCETPSAALTEGLAGPALAGVLRPTLLMPAACVEEMSAAEIEAILAHELAHLRRGDPALHAVCSLLLLPVGFHPAALWTARRVRQTREMACDAEAAERLGSASGYAHALLQVAERSGGLRGAGVGLGLFGLGFFGLGLFDSDIRPHGGYRAAVRGGRLQHGRRSATAGLPLFGVAGAMEERMQTMMSTKPQETGAKRVARGVAAAGLAAVAVMAAAMVQVQPALAHPKDAGATQALNATDDAASQLIGGDHAQQQLQNAHHQLAEAAMSATTDAERSRLATAQVVIETAEQQLAAVSGRNRQRDTNSFMIDPKMQAELDKRRDFRVDPKVIADAAKMKAYYESPEWKAQIKKQITEAEQMRARINSPEFQAQIAAARNFDHAKMDAQVREALETARQQIEQGKKQRAEATQQMREALRQQAEAKRLMARIEPPSMPAEPTAPAPPPVPGQGANKPAKIEGGIMAGQVLTKVQPKYPQSAKDAHISGAVVLRALIDETGKIQQLQLVSSPDRALTESAMDAVRQWVYRPYLLNGNPTSVETNITVTFSFEGAELIRPGGAMSEQDRPVLLTQVDPEFPAEARKNGTSGAVTLRLSIGKTGRVDAVQAVTSPDPLLSKAAMDAVKQWTFRPAVRNGVLVATNTLVSVNFQVF
ncbi:TonB family protein [Terriglobus roseus DSM 18391]|uniref:TonB family protein n=1 Tax=Terriglobus roseus (strain DSM 18391 / NRRL B-41598 / KBS 63) TaxID=926566 RepID=I3ZD98_TERRK|nr:TonB family protein [Terriglobus roseus]AFL87216.1 TonB family protein [Terriglobus roseus DSM 18391]